MKSKKISKNAAMKRAFSNFAINGRTFAYCLDDLLFGCKTPFDKGVNEMTELISLLDNPFGNKKTGKINAEVIKKYFRENPVTFRDNYDFRYVTAEEIAVFTGYAGIVELPEGIFELVLVLGKYVSDDDDLQCFAEEVSRLFDNSFDKNDVIDAIKKLM